jgi:glyoxylase-like metal-dependent hydrolase (beta-lactamase superfamily II)
VGDATASILNLGDLSFRLADVEGSPESEWRPRYGELFDKRLWFPSQSVHVLTRDASILVDAGDYALFASADPSYIPENYTPPSTLIEQLADIGVGRNDVTHVVITHAHYDHFAGVTTKTNGTYSPTFPRARYLLGRADWDNPEMRRALRERDSAEAVSLGVLDASGLLELVDGEKRLTPEVAALAAPGESPGHQIVRVHSGGQTLYCLGDLFHHAVEVEDIKLMSNWCDPPTNTKSRQELLKAALSENAVLVAAHMPPGRLTGSLDDVRFLTV